MSFHVMPASSPNSGKLPVFAPQSLQSERLYSVQSFLQDQSSVAPLQQRQPSRHEWELWKADIHRWYILKNKTLEEVKRLVYNKHNLCPTTKQLTKRLQQWNFRKNKIQKHKVPRGRAIIEVQHPRPVESMKALAETRKDPNTYKGDNETSIDLEIFEVGSQPQQSMSMSYTSRMTRRDRFKTVIPGSKQSGQLNEECAIILTRNTSATPSLPAICSSSGERFMNGLAEQLSERSISFQVDLSRFPQPSLSDTSMPKEYLTREELRGLEVCNAVGKQDAFTDTAWIKHSQQPVSRQHGPLKYPGHDVDFPSSMFIPSLSGELYPFPRRPNSDSPRTSSTPKIVVLRTAILDYLSKFKALSRLQRPDNDPAMIQLMYKLGEYYRYTRQYRESEIWYRRELSARRVSDESSATVQILRTELYLIDAICAQGRYEESMLLHETVHRKIINYNATDRHDCLLAKSILARGCILLHSAYFRDAEACFRQALQIRLGCSGPWGPDNLGAMLCLGNVLQCRKGYEESEKLMIITAQLYKSKNETDCEEIYWTLETLARAKDHQGKFDECEAIYRHVITGVETKLGKEHPSTAFSMHNYAQALLNMGQVDESEKMARNVLDLQANIGLDTSHTVSLLGNILRKKCCYKEAAQCYERTMREYTLTLGSDNIKTIRDCNGLAKCYGELGWFEDALQLLGKYIQDVETQVASRKEPCWGDGGLEQIQWWMRYFKDRMKCYREELRPSRRFLKFMNSSPHLLTTRIHRARGNIC